MKFRFLLILLFTTKVHSQNFEITKRDERNLQNNELPLLIQNLGSAYNFISDKTNYQNEIDEYIRKIVSGSRNSRIFFNDQVVVESDIVPGSDTLRTRTAMIIMNYLNDFNSLYTHTESPTVVVKLLKVSTLKKTNYLFYNAVFDCTFEGTNSSNQSYTTVRRIAEIRVDKDSIGWIPLINSIRFFSGDFSIEDSLNNFTEFKPDPTDSMSVDEIRKEMNEAKLKLQSENGIKTRTAINEGDQYFDAGDFEKAKIAYSNAWTFDPHNKEVLDKRAKARVAIDKKNKEEKERKERELRITEMQMQALENFQAFEFETASVLYDSLLLFYGIKNDTTVNSKRSQLAVINSSVDAIENALRGKRYDDAQKLCDKDISNSTNQLLQIECYFLKAKTYFIVDSTNFSKIHKFLDLAILKSNSGHARAMALQAYVFMIEKKFDDAIRMASLLVNLHNTEAKYYILRADIHTANKNNDAAIKDFGKAIELRTSDSTASVKKAKLEFETGNYRAAIITTSAILKQNPSYQNAYYYRAVSLEKSSDFESAGSDYWKAKQFGLDSVSENTIHSISDTHWMKGKSELEKTNYSGAIIELTNSILLDSSSNALYWRATAYFYTSQLKNSENDLSILIRRSPKFTNAYYQRGIVRSKMEKYTEAIMDFDEEIKLTPGYYNSYGDKAKAEMKISMFAAAGKDGSIAARELKNDEFSLLATLAYYKADSLDKAIETADFAEEELKTINDAVYYLRGRAYFDKGIFKKAKSNFERAIELNSLNYEANYWNGKILLDREEYASALNYFLKSLGTKEYPAEANYYTGICRVKLKSQDQLKYSVENFNEAMKKDSLKYMNSCTYSWMAYSSLYQNKSEQIDDFLQKAEKLDSSDSFYNYVQSCVKAQSHLFELSLHYFEKATKGGNFKKDDVKNEIYLSALLEEKNYKSKFRELIDKYCK